MIARKPSVAQQKNMLRSNSSSLPLLAGEDVGRADKRGTVPVTHNPKNS